jgi:uncharacterized protein (TIGR03000 family)
MIRRLTLLVGSTLLASTLFLAEADAHGPGGGGAHSGYHGGGYHYGGYYYPYHGSGFYGPYRPGLYAPYGFYRPYYGGFFGPGLAFGSGLGLGLGLGYGLGGYGLGGYGLGGYGGYLPYYGGGAGGVAPGVAAAPPGAPGGVAAPPGTPPAGSGEPPLAPPPDNAAHLQLVVPPDAEVLFGGSKTTQTGATREFVSPTLQTGKLFDYTITVRYTDANGKAVTDKRVIHVRANDWFRVDFTRPAPPEPPVP